EHCAAFEGGSTLGAARGSRWLPAIRRAAVEHLHNRGLEVAEGIVYVAFLRHDRSLDSDLLCDLSGLSVRVSLATLCDESGYPLAIEANARTPLVHGVQNDFDVGTICLTLWRSSVTIERFVSAPTARCCRGSSRLLSYLAVGLWGR